MHRFKELRVWDESRVFAKEVYMLTSHFPDAEKFNLVSQIRRSAVSIVANIAEGAGRNNPAEFKHFLGIANGSAFEVESLLILSVDLGMLNSEQVENEIDRLRKIQNMIFKLRDNVKSVVRDT